VDQMRMEALLEHMRGIKNTIRGTFYIAEHRYRGQYNAIPSQTGGGGEDDDWHDAIQDATRQTSFDPGRHDDCEVQQPHSTWARGSTLGTHMTYQSAGRQLLKLKPPKGAAMETAPGLLEVNDHLAFEAEHVSGWGTSKTVDEEKREKRTEQRVKQGAGRVNVKLQAPSHSWNDQLASDEAEPLLSAIAPGSETQTLNREVGPRRLPSLQGGDSLGLGGRSTARVHPE